MSRLDYITIAIVAACILAIIFLVSKMTDLFGDSATTDKIENVADTVEEEGTDSDTYDYETETKEDGTDDAPATDESTADEGTSSSDSEPATDGTSSSTDADEDTSTTATTGHNSHSNAGKYMVIAGTYMKKANAVSQVRKLKKLGFENARVELFDRGKFAIVLVDRFSTMASAERLVKDLKAEGISSYVKAKEAH
ncbi:MAG TPA: hypothetical protein ENJ95_24715 [Bacteroidetes bacterium]|nr:hypothetical protein [Bacteroidota bacterium]